MKQVTVYTDGACRGNPGPGGYGVILQYGPVRRELSGGEAETTNNRMELTAAIAALSALKEPCSVTLYSDSRYLVDAVNLGWARAWQAAGWRGGKVKNPDLWQKLLELLALHDVTFLWVRGHAGHTENERCDALATAESVRFRADTGSAPPIISQGENT